MALRTMCVSGSRIASISVLSSSVSWPSISKRTFLPQATARSRTMRGNLLSTLPIGCIRVFITLACNSVVSRLSRCTAPRKPRSSCECAVLQDLIAGQDQFAHERHQLVEQAHVDANVAHPPLATRLGASVGSANRRRQRRSIETVASDAGRSLSWRHWLRRHGAGGGSCLPATLRSEFPRRSRRKRSLPCPLSRAGDRLRPISAE